MSALSIPVIHGAALDRPDEQDTLESAQAIFNALRDLGYRSAIVPIGPDMRAVSVLAVERPDLVFNLVEALGGETALAAEVPAELAARGLAFTGCGARASHLSVSKPRSKQIMTRAGLPTPRWSVSGAGLGTAERVIIKSATEHASIGIDPKSVVPGSRAIFEIIARAMRFGGTFFAETYVEGREFNLSLLQDVTGVEVLPPAEIEFTGFEEGQPRIVDYDAKWTVGSHGYQNTPRRFDFPATDDALLAELSDLALKAWTLFGLSGYARVDFRVDWAGRPWILEVNTNPCLAPDAGFCAAAERAGLGFGDVVERIVRAGLGARRRAA